jgi:putative transposase
LRGVGWRREYGGLKRNQAWRLRDELLDLEILCSLAEACVPIEAWRHHCNTERPHSSLGHRPPTPVTIDPPRRPLGCATIRFLASVAVEAPMH